MSGIKISNAKEMSHNSLKCPFSFNFNYCNEEKVEKEGGERKRGLMK